MSILQDVHFILLLIAVVVAVLILASSRRSAAKMVVHSAAVGLYTSLIWVLFPLTDAKCTWPNSIEDAFEQILLCRGELIHWVLVGALWLALGALFVSLIRRGRASGPDGGQLPLR
jgi:hypothetical protein